MEGQISSTSTFICSHICRNSIKGSQFIVVCFMWYKFCNFRSPFRMSQIAIRRWSPALKFPRKRNSSVTFSPTKTAPSSSHQFQLAITQWYGFAFFLLHRLQEWACKKSNPSLERFHESREQQNIETWKTFNNNSENVFQTFFQQSLPLKNMFLLPNDVSITSCRGYEKRYLA